jgi:hypothetical protein
VRRCGGLDVPTGQPSGDLDILLDAKESAVSGGSFVRECVAPNRGRIIRGRIMLGAAPECGAGQSTSPADPTTR